MAQPALSLDHLPVTHQVALPQSPAAILRLSGDGDASGSPARDLHDRLVSSFGAVAPVRDDRLPLGLRLAIISAAAIAPWAVIGTILIASFA